MTVETFTKSGAKAATPVKLDKAIFSVKVGDHNLLKDAYLAYLANGRTNTARAQTRGEVRGGGQKPWRQKGTGRARFGSSRNPIWKGGGVAFGPSGKENFKRKISTKAKRQALRQALSLAVNEDRIKVIDSFDFSEGRVKQVIDLVGKIKAKGSILLVDEQRTDLFEHATRNLSNVKVVKAHYLAVYDLLNADTILISKKALEVITERLGAKNERS